MATPSDGLKLNGLAVKSWGDVIAVATLIAMLLSVVAWGLKLETELNGVRDRVGAVEARVADGILPRAEERINANVRELEEIERRLERLEDAEIRE